MMKLVGAGVGCAWAGFPSAGLAAAKPRLRAAACRFKVDVEVGAATLEEFGEELIEDGHEEVFDCGLPICD